MLQFQLLVRMGIKLVGAVGLFFFLIISHAASWWTGEGDDELVDTKTTGLGNESDWINKASKFPEC